MISHTFFEFEFDCAVHAEHVHRDRDHEAHSTQAHRVHVRALRNAQMSVDYFRVSQQVRVPKFVITSEHEKN